MDIDQALIEGCLKKDRVSQKALYDILLPYLNPVCRRYLLNPSDVHDALQEAFVNIFVHIDKYDKTKSMFQTWAVRIAIHSSFKVNKKMNREVAVEVSNLVLSKTVQPDIFSQLEFEDAVAFLRTMPLDYYEVFNLFVIDGYSHQDIAVLLEIGESLSRKRLSRARQWIKEHMKNTFIEKVGEKILKQKTS